MSFAALQPAVKALLLADPTLAALGEPFSYSPEADEKSAEEAMAAVRRTTGVAIEIGEPWLAQVANPGGGGTSAHLYFELFVSESPIHDHTPRGLALLDAIVPVLRERGRFEAIDTGESYVVKERGYVLRILTFRTIGRWDGR